MKAKHLILGLFAAALTFTSCTNDEGVNFTPADNFGDGILITNEGPFNSGNGSVSYVSNDLSKVYNNIYYSYNNEYLGNIVQSMAFNNDKAYVVANNSNRITVVNRYTFFKEATIDAGLSNPRYMTFANGKGYVTNWGDGTDANDDYVAVIDLATNTVESTISVSEGPEHIEAINGKLYVSHKGGYGYGTTISVIDAANTVASTITVGDVPDDMVVDGNNNLWVVCSGKPSWAASGETAGKLVKVNTTTDTVETSLDFTAATDHPQELALENGTLYFAKGGAIYEMSETATTLPTASIITTPTYTMAVKDGKLYATDAGNYTDDGTLKVFDLSDDSEIQSITVGLIPGGIYFN